MQPVLENINCPVCGSAEHKLVFKARDLRLKTCGEAFCVVACVNCGFLFLNPRPVKEDAIKFYPVDFNMETPTLIHRLLSVSLSAIKNSIVSKLKKYKKEGTLLDIGCGSGSFLSLMQEQGYDVLGCELNPNSKKFAPKSLDGRIIYKKLPECNFLAKSFDIVTMIQSLEHVHEVDRLFLEIKRIIKDDGIIYIYVPNSDFFESAFFGPYYFNLEVPRHLYYFTRKSMKGFLQNHGFKVDRFFKNHILEIASTPSSLHYGLWSWLEDKNIFKNKTLKYLTFIPLIFCRILLRFIFIFNDQNIEVVCYKE